MDLGLDLAMKQINSVTRETAIAPVVKCFFDVSTATATYVVSDPSTGAAAVIDSVLDFDQAAGHISFEISRTDHLVYKG